MRKLILATASAIALGIAGATPLYAQNLNTGPAATPAPAQDQGTAAGTMQPATPQAGNQMQQMPPAAGADINNPNLANSSQSGADMGRLSRSDIRDIQQKLSQDGLYRGRIDGRVGPETRQAVRSFQQKNGLPETGSLDQQTLASLNAGGPGVGSSTMPNAASDNNMPPPSSSGATNPNPPPMPNNQR